MGSILDKMKKDASNTRAIIQTTEADTLWKITNRLFFLPKNIIEETAFVKHVMTRGAEHQERIGLHASALLASEKEYCERAQILSLVYRQNQGENIPVGLKKIFEEGNAIHEKWQRLFLRGGYCTYLDLDNSQMNKEFKISFTPDIICEIPEFHKGKMIIEVKSVNTFQYQKMAKHPKADKQLQFYMYLSGIHKGAVLNEDKNNQDNKFEVYDYDESKVEVPVTRAKRIKVGYKNLVMNGKLVKRPSDAKAPDCKKCNLCAMRETCWGMSNGGKLIKPIEELKKEFM